MVLPTQELYAPVQDAIVELFQLDLNSIGVNQIYYFCNETVNNGSSVTFQGKTYHPAPIKVEGFMMSSDSKEQVTPTIRVGNVLGAITALVLAYQDLRGVTLIRKRTNAKYLDGQPTANPLLEYMPDIFYVERKVSETSLEISFELKTAIEYGMSVKVPKRQILPNQCQWRYRSAECGYTGGAVADINDNPTNNLAFDNCGLRVSSCKFRFGEYGVLNWGGYEGVDNRRF